MDIVSKLQLEENDIFVGTNAENIPWFMPMEYPSSGNIFISSNLLNVKTEDGTRTAATYVLAIPYMFNNRGGKTYYGGFIEVGKDSALGDVFDVEKHLKVTEWKEYTKADIDDMPAFLREICEKD